MRCHVTSFFPLELDMIDPVETSLSIEQLFANNDSCQRTPFNPDEFEEAYDFPPGRYFIGDPCYALEREDWDELISYPAACIADIDDLGRCIYFDHPFVDDDEGRSYTSDSGCLGIVPINRLATGHLAALKELGRIVEFTEGDPAPDDSDEFWEPSFSVMTTSGGSIFLGWNWFISDDDRPVDCDDDEDEIASPSV